MDAVIRRKRQWIRRGRTSRTRWGLGVDSGCLGALIDSLSMDRVAGAGLMPTETSDTGISHNRSLDVVCMRRP